MKFSERRAAARIAKIARQGRTLKSVTPSIALHMVANRRVEIAPNVSAVEIIRAARKAKGETL